MRARNEYLNVYLAGGQLFALQGEAGDKLLRYYGEYLSDQSKNGCAGPDMAVDFRCVQAMVWVKS